MPTGPMNRVPHEENAPAAEAQDRPFICPRCGSRNVRVYVDAGSGQQRLVCQQRGCENTPANAHQNNG
jgi:transcription elongation factor Elf1